MTGLLIAICFGWMGGYRFYKKQIGMGVLYLCTGGLACIGWIYDIYAAYKEMKRPKPINARNTLSNAIKVQIAGAHHSCAKDESRKRIEIIQSKYVGDKLSLEFGHLNGNRYFLVVDPNSGLDIGALPHDLNRELLLNNCYPENLTAVLSKRDIDKPEITIYINKN